MDAAQLTKLAQYRASLRVQISHHLDQAARLAIAYEQTSDRADKLLDQPHAA